MKEKIITNLQIEKFHNLMLEEEKSPATIEKYLRDIRKFAEYAKGTYIDKRITLAFKEELSKEYAASSVNSMLTAMNTFLKFLGWEEFCVKQVKVQKKVYCPEEKELTQAEYIRLVNTARTKGNERLSLIIQTICGTGIRVSELQFITLEAVKRGETVVDCKGKSRTVFIVPKLRKKLLAHAKKREIKSGPIFITRNGAPISRCNIWREMKALCKDAGVSSSKVFPHNLRHLFARVFYGIEKDIAKLADILGHSSIDTTRIYIMSTGVEHRRKMERMKLIL